jgi:Putative DNA-binding domain
MTKDQLLALLGNNEDNFVERKPEGVAPGELRQTLCAFANSVPQGRAGVLLIGVHDKTGDVIGVGNPDQVQKRVRDAAQSDCFPPIAYTAEVLVADGKAVVAVVVPFSNARPHFSGPAYVRVGSESPKASQQQYEELILSRNDKAREILRHRNGVFTVLGIGYKLGSNRPLPDKAYREMRECRLLECTAHLVTLEDIARGDRFSEPLSNVTVSYDHEKWRAMLMVTLPA